MLLWHVIFTLVLLIALFFFFFLHVMVKLHEEKGANTKTEYWLYSNLMPWLHSKTSALQHVAEGKLKGFCLEMNGSVRTAPPADN